MTKTSTLFAFISIILCSSLYSQGVNLASSATITTSNNNNQSKMYLVDRNIATRWSAAYAGISNIDFILTEDIRFATVTLSNVVAFWGYKIFTSTNGSSWEEKASYRPENTNAFTATRSKINHCVNNTFNQFRYVRIQLNGYMGIPAIGEISIYEDNILFTSFSLSSSNYINPLNIFDDDINTAATNNYYGPRNFSLSFKEVLQAAKVEMKTQDGGFKMDLYNGSTLAQNGYYYTLGDVETFYIINPDGFNKLLFTGNASQMAIYDIKVEKLNINSVSLTYNYDAQGKMTFRTILFASSFEAEIPQNDTLPPSYFDENTPPIEDQYKNIIIQVYPNPTRGKIRIIAKRNHHENINIQLTTLSGQQLQKEAMNEDETELDLSSKPTGTYLLNLSVDGEKHQWTIIKK